MEFELTKLGGIMLKGHTKKKKMGMHGHTLPSFGMRPMSSEYNR